MDFRFIAPDLRRLDEASAELLACCIWSDVRPARGLAGLLDFRFAGKLSRLSRESFLQGSRDEVVLVPGRPRCPFEKVLVFGLGSRADFSEPVYTRAVQRISRALEQLHVVRAVVELPGRADAGIAPDRAAELLVPAIASDAHDTWWLVEGGDAQKQMEHKIQGERRRLRRA